MASGPDAMRDFLEKTLQSECVVELNTGSEIRGILCTVDGLFNVVLKGAKEFNQKGELINEFPSIFIRGNFVLQISRP